MLFYCYYAKSPIHVQLKFFKFHNGNFMPPDQWLMEVRLIYERICSKVVQLKRAHANTNTVCIALKTIKIIRETRSKWFNLQHNECGKAHICFRTFNVRYSIEHPVSTHMHAWDVHNSTLKRMLARTQSPSNEFIPRGNLSSVCAHFAPFSLLIREIHFVRWAEMLQPASRWSLVMIRFAYRIGVKCVSTMKRSK